MDQTAPSVPSASPAWQPFEPADGWNLQWAGHLLRRAGFGPTWPELQKALADGPQKTIDRLMQPSAEAQAFDRQMDQWEQSANTMALVRAWWLRRMFQTPQPLVEKMTLFWHGHLALGNARAVPGPLVRDYLRTIRQYCLGRLDQLLQAAVLHPAMLLSHDAQANRKAQPTKHFARILLEHFTLGPDGFTEKDVQETARALTGWFVFRDELRFIEREYDPGRKRLFGHWAPIGAQELFELLARHPATTKSIVSKLYRFFVSEAEPPDQRLLEPLANQLREGSTIGQVVETILRSKWFFSQAAYRRRIKGPVEWALGVLRPMEALMPTEPLAHALRELGQALAEPPTPAGWPDGIHWITPPLLLLRAKWAQQFWAPGSPFGQKLDPVALASRYGAKTPTAQAEFLLQLYLQGDLPAEAHTQLLSPLRGANHQEASRLLPTVCQSVALLPEFQLA